MAYPEKQRFSKFLQEEINKVNSLKDVSIQNLLIHLVLKKVMC